LEKLCGVGRGTENEYFHGDQKHLVADQMHYPKQQGF
jgi:hypothetical protein